MNPKKPGERHHHELDYPDLPKPKTAKKI